MGQKEITELIETLVKSDARFTFTFEANDEVHFEDKDGRFWSVKISYKGSRETGLER